MSSISRLNLRPITSLTTGTVWKKSDFSHFNQYGLTAGGPVFIPKVFNGKNKLFWFISWENDANSQPNTAFMSVPTAAERVGDFSQILKTDGTQLYDPYSGVASGKQYQSHSLCQ